MKLVDNYWISCCQFWGKSGQAGDSEDEFKKVRQENVDKYRSMLDRTCRGMLRDDKPGWGWESSLIVFPEMSLTGVPMRGDYERKGIPMQDWIEKGCVYIPGEETEKIAEKTAEYGVYIIGMGYERNDDFPGAFFNTCFIMDPNGKILSKYRRFHTIAVSPDDILDEFLKKVGWDGLFPVADTPLGKLAALACGEIRFPEVARMFGMKGVEVLAHCDSSGYPEPGLEADISPLALAWSFCRRARAIENKCYVPRANAGGASEIIDFFGRTLARTQNRGEESIRAPVCMSLLREAKNEQQLIRLRGDIFAHFYKELNTWPSNQWKDKIPPLLRQARKEHRKKAVKRCIELGILRPEAKGTEGYY